MTMVVTGTGYLLLWIIPTGGLLMFVSGVGAAASCLNGKLVNCVRDSCKRTSAGRTVCAEGCVDGFYGMSCRIPCPEDCLECQRTSGSCTKCSNGLLGENCDVACEQMCRGFRCFNNGTCSDTTCLDGWFGLRCECKASNTIQSGDRGRICLPHSWGTCCNRTCPNNCRNNRSGRLCNLTTGQCIAGCKNGWVGKTCNSTCNESSCKHTPTSTVIVEVQRTFSSCLPNEWGESCSNTCPEGCTKIDTARGCDVKTGVCINGCMVGKYGPTCDMKCPENCANGTCNINDGTCDCIDGMCGDVCQLPCGSTDKPDGPVSMVSSGTLNIAVSSLFVVVAALICFQCRHAIKKHFINRHGDTGTNEHVQEEDDTEQDVHLNEGHRYYSIDDSDLDNSCSQVQQDGMQSDNNINILQRNDRGDSAVYSHDGYADCVSLPDETEPTNDLPSDSIVCDSDGVLHYIDRSGTIAITYITPQTSG
ncbi:platelet endothelial aggregation receptor 1-like [Haliotis rubra]|uniref:platelet endothelial aggregation receptor 1-like n=1 Tax=Haliotis rubra TaxID=36100 RepID=UPI001EE52182|nr:platelet endothelial aggregation receptor 1-like [Haliotis rubra]